MTVLQYGPTERLDAISEQAHQVDAGKAALGVIAAVLILVGKTIGVVRLALVWSFVAVRTGYRDINPPRRRDGGAG